MTKKFLIAYSEQGVRKTKKNEFLIPNLSQIDRYFIGIESGRICQFGMVVYTGMDLDPSIVMEKLQKNKIISEANSSAENILSDYLNFIKSCRISDVIGINIESGQYKYFVTGLKPRTGISNIPE